MNFSNLSSKQPGIMSLPFKDIQIKITINYMKMRLLKDTGLHQ
jgi:hypothetical protein